MKKIGLIGGLTWHSTLEYYRQINELINLKMGGVHSASLCLESIDFQNAKDLLDENKWEDFGRLVTQAAINLEKSEADFITICSNATHKVVDQVKREIKIPILHIGDVTADEINKNGIKKVAFFGTRPTMLEDFIISKIVRHGVNVQVPSLLEIDEIHRIIFDELAKGKVSQKSSEFLLGVLNRLIKVEKVEGLVLGCTELTLIINQTNVSVPLFDTLAIHVAAAVHKANTFGLAPRLVEIRG